MGKHKPLVKPKPLAPAFVFSLFNLIFATHSVSALTYSQDVGTSFTFSPMITISVSGDLLINNLAPGSFSDSNIVTINVESNNIAGYSVSATVGDSNQAYTDLRIDSNNANNAFSALSSNVASLSAFSDDKWGYSYSSNGGTTWVSGNVGSTSTGYNGLPLYTGTGVLIIDTSSAGISTVQFKIGARASTVRSSGSYTNVINFLTTSKIQTTDYTFSYLPNDGNGGADVSNMPSPATLSGTITDNLNLTLSNAVPTRTDYTFVGWCDGTVTTTNFNDSCSGTTYQPGDNYVIANVGDSVTYLLYALWETNTRFINFGVCDNRGDQFATSCSDPDMYIAEENMTWGDWIESEYSDAAREESDDGVTYEIGYYDIDDYYHDVVYIVDYYEDGSRLSSDTYYLYVPGNNYYVGYVHVSASDYIEPNAIYNLPAECLTGDHLITMGDGSLKRLDEIKCGDYVRSYDWTTNKLVPKKVIFSDADEGKTHVEYDKWTFDDGTIIKTVHRHEFYNAEAKRFKYMDEWKIGEHTYKEDGTKPALVAHELVKKTVRHYKITLEGGTNYFANGLLTGDRNNPKEIIL